MKLFSTETCASLPLISPKLVDEIIAAPRTTQTHRTFMAKLPALHLMERCEDVAYDQCLPEEMSVLAWNLERCISPMSSAQRIAQYAPDVVLLSEMDCGMSRTQQQHTTKLLADNLNMNYIFGVEFFEIGLGSGPELEFAEDDFNACGWHGNAILSKVPAKFMALIRLDDHGHWYCMSDGTDQNQPRIGGRMALAAIYPSEKGDVCFVSTHLESAGSLSIRQSQIDRIIAAVDAFAPGLPVICGGDLNTGNNLADFDWKRETLFQAAERQGFDWDCNASGTTTRPSKLTRFPDRAMKLDWFMKRNLAGKDPKILPALDRNNEPISDHELIAATFSI